MRWGMSRLYTTTGYSLWLPQKRSSHLWEQACQFQRKTIIQSTRVEHTLLEVENNSPEGSVDGADTLSPTSRVPLGG